MKRVLIVGSPGSGKTTLGRTMSRMLGLPLVHLDKLFWRKGWVNVANDEFDRLLAAAMEGDCWIIDGNYGRTLEMRLKRADTAVLLDYPTHVCVFRVLGRVFKGYGKTREDMGEGCPERLDLEFLRYVLGFRRNNREKLLEKLRSAPGVELFAIRNNKELKEFIKSIEPHKE